MRAMNTDGLMRGMTSVTAVINEVDLELNQDENNQNKEVFPIVKKVKDEIRELDTLNVPGELTKGQRLQTFQEKTTQI